MTRLKLIVAFSDLDIGADGTAIPAYHSVTHDPFKLAYRWKRPRGRKIGEGLRGRTTSVERSQNRVAYTFDFPGTR
jgi:hypothetical protein